MDYTYFNDTYNRWFSGLARSKGHIMKLYELKFTVRHGDLCFDFTHLFEAKDDEDSDRLAHKWCCDYYGEGELEEENYYTFQTGCIGLKITSVKEITDKEEWKEQQYENSFLRNI